MSGGDITLVGLHWDIWSSCVGLAWSQLDVLHRGVSSPHTSVQDIKLVENWLGLLGEGLYCRVK